MHRHVDHQHCKGRHKHGEIGKADERAAVSAERAAASLRAEADAGEAAAQRAADDVAAAESALRNRS